jgi:Fe-S-cluster-containing dehydrogenase component/CRP-like cAMP-binding protein
MQQTELHRIEQYRDRWSTFDAESGILRLSDKPSVEQLRTYDLFDGYEDAFLEQIAPDVSIATWSAGSVLFEEGSYLDLAFYVASGEVEVFVAGIGAPAQSLPIFATSVASPEVIGVAEEAQQTVFETRALAMDPSRLTFLSTMDFDLPRGQSTVLKSGEIFGEIGALSGWPQSVTGRVASDAELLQIRLPALRLMRRKSKALKERLDTLYRDRSLSQQLAVAPLFNGVGRDFITALADRVSLVSCDPDEVVAAEGNEVDSLYLLRSGYLRLSRAAGEGQVVVGYLSKGMTVGEVELLVDGIDTRQHSITSVGYSELVRIGRPDFEDLVRRFPFVEAGLWKRAVEAIRETGASMRTPGRPDFIKFSLERGLVEGNSILAIDLDACTRCDDCVRACADLHDGRPRFVREGEKYGNLLITKACYHCEDPVCLIGCPTGAIRRANVGDVVDIEEPLCIGCSVCATACPYDAIIMHGEGEVWPANALPKGLRGKDRRVASKCDLCYTTDRGPACVSSCPQGCAFRVGTLDEFEQLLSKQP